MKTRSGIWHTLAVMAGAVFAVSLLSSGAQAQTAPSFNFDPTWPKSLPNLWKMGGVTGLAR